MNARVQEGDGGHIGDRICREGNDNGRRMKEITQQFGLWAPSTFSEYHSGRDETWSHPKGGKARLDYVLVSRTMDCIPTWSWVDEDFQTSLTVRDHEAVILDLQLHRHEAEQKDRKKNYDWEQMATEEGRKRLQIMIDGIQELPWHVDVHTHWQILQDQIHSGLEAEFPAPKRKQRIDIFSQQTQQLLDRRKRAKSGLDLCDYHLDNIDLRLAIKAWRSSLTIGNFGCIFQLEEMITVIALQMLKKLFRTTSLKLREAIKVDKANFIEQVVIKANNSGKTDIYRELRPLRIGGVQRRRGVPTMPGFQINGIRAVTAAQSEEIWLQHCAVLEAGLPTTTTRLVQRARKQAFERTQHSEIMSMELIPTRTALEGAFRHVKMRKSGGTDQLRSDVCHLASAALAHKHFGLLLKLCVQKEEPCHMKGGVLVPAFKQGDPADPASHRSLLLSSHVGKSLRRSIRQKILPTFEETAPASHLSCRQGGCVSHASQMLRLFISGAAGMNQSVGILYVDVKSAYYRVIQAVSNRRRSRHGSSSSYARSL